MAKTKKQTNNGGGSTGRGGLQASLAINEIFTARKQALKALLGDAKRDLDNEAGYPLTIGPKDYKDLWDREGIAARVVSIFPDESWQVEPVVFETEDNDEETAFEKDWEALKKRLNIYHYLHRADELSGIGHYGVMLLGINDGKELSEPVDGINDRGEVAGNSPDRQLLYVRVFDESLTSIQAFEEDVTNPRFGFPKRYRIEVEESARSNTHASVSKHMDVHWTRIIHIADNRKASEVYGTPRMKNVYNRLFDLKKIHASSPEMFFRGGFMGISIEVPPDLAAQGVEIDKESMRDEFEDYANGLKRYMALQGATANPLAPQVSDPSPHAETQLKAIAISKGIPYRIFMGTEEGRLAGGQDQRAWNTRIKRRQEKYISPLVISPFVERMIALGVVSAPSEKNSFTIFWPDIHTPTEEDKAKVAELLTNALAKYVQGNVGAIMELEDYLVHVHGMEQKEVKEITENVMMQIREEDRDPAGGINDDEEDEEEE